MAEVIYRQPIAEVLPERFLQYSQAVIQDRAISDGFDGLKPVHRRILMAMNGLGLRPGTAYKKCAKTVGEVLGKYHPHGDQSVYDAMVGMAQEFTMRYPLVDGSGNFGSVNGDPAAAMRYTEARLSPFGELMLQDVEKLSDTKDNYDNSEQEPLYLSSYFPNLLCNPAAGIAVGLAAKFAPHYARDVYEAIMYAIRQQADDKEIELEALIDFIKAPDFPTGAEIINGEEVKNIYRSGNGPVTLRAKYRMEKDSIVYYEIPYKVMPKAIIQSIVGLEIPDIKDVRDESSLAGLRIVVELKKGANSDWIINKLFKETPLQGNYSVNMTAIMDSRPVQNLDLKTIIMYYLRRLSMVHFKRLTIEKEEYARKLFIVLTMLKAISHIDEIIRIVRTEDDPVATMIKLLGFTKEEAEYIYNIRLSSLSKASKEELDQKEKEYKAEIARIDSILDNNKNFLVDLHNTIKEIQTSKLFKDDRRHTDILNISGKDSGDMRDYIKNEPVIINYSNKGMIKAMRPDEFKTVKRNSVGVKQNNLRDDEVIVQTISTDTHSDLLLVTNLGRSYVLPVYKIPVGGKNSASKSINNYINLADGENVLMVAKTPEKPEDYSLVLATKLGYIKRLEFSLLLVGRVSTVGTKVISLVDNDALCGLCICEKNADVSLFTSQGRGIKFNIDDETSPVRPMGKSARGVTAIRLKPRETVVAAAKLEKEGSVLLLTTKGFGKRIDVKSFKSGKRAQTPVNYMAKIDEVGEIVGAVMVTDTEDVLITTNQGQTLRLDVAGQSIMGRTAKGLKMISIKSDDDTVATLVSIERQQEESQDE